MTNQIQFPRLTQKLFQRKLTCSPKNLIHEIIEKLYSGMQKINILNDHFENIYLLCSWSAINYVRKNIYCSNKEEVDYSHGFSSVFFPTPEVTKIVLPKVLQNFKLYLFAQGTEPKKFFLLFPRNIQFRARLKGPPFVFFSAL